MINNVLLYIGSAVITLWGIAHIAPTKSVVNGFGSISEDNKRIITMEWIAEGLTLCFIGLLVLFITILGGSHNPVSIIVYRISALMLLVMASLSLFTGARTSICTDKDLSACKDDCCNIVFVGGVSMNGRWRVTACLRSAEGIMLSEVNRKHARP